MKTKIENSDRMDDLIFENRNQDYGAYVIRKSYYDNVNKAFLVALSIASLLIMLHFMPSFWRSKSDGSHAATPTLDPNKVIDLTRVIVETLPRQMSQITQHVSRSVVPTQVTTEEVVEAQHVDLNAITTTVGDDDATENPFTTDTEVGSSTGSDVDANVVSPPADIIAVGIMAEYNGGINAMANFLTRHLKYPAIARKHEIEGTVYVSFIVNKEGKVIRPEVVKGISKECDEEAIRVVSLMPGWKAAKQNGMAVMVRMMLPIKFELGD